MSVLHREYSPACTATSLTADEMSVLFGHNTALDFQRRRHFARLDRKRFGQERNFFDTLKVGQSRRLVFDFGLKKLQNFWIGN